jgi:hypothetical protein
MMMAEDDDRLALFLMTKRPLLMSIISNMSEIGGQ